MGSRPPVYRAARVRHVDPAARIPDKPMKYLKPFSSLSPEELGLLEEGLARFYTNPPPAYHAEAEAANEDWSGPQYGPHRAIVSGAVTGSKILDVGCGSASAAAHFRAAGAVYTGVDVSEEQLQAARAKYPWASFLRCGWDSLGKLDGEFDMVTSFFVLEHIPRPREFLSACASKVRRGGLLAVLAPEYLERGFMPSLHLFGTRPGGLRAKLAGFDLPEALRTAFDKYVSFPLLLRRARGARGGAWLINLKPVCLEAVGWDIDWDAVYMVGQREVAGYIRDLGFEILEPGSEAGGGRSGFCYVLARKL